MKTALVTPCFLEGKDALGNYRLSRNIRYIDYYIKLQGNLLFDDLWLFDNASTHEKIESLYAHLEGKPFSFFRFPARIERSNGPYGYGYCWRALHALYLLMDNGYEKIFMIDSDCFVLSQRLVDFMNECNTGWQTLWCKKWDFPESSFQIINKDAFPLFKEFFGKDPLQHLGKCMETTLPFTHVNKDFYSDRYGEDRIPQQHGMDLYCQAPTNICLKFAE